MNLVLDDAYEVYKKKNTRTALGEDLLSLTHTHTIHVPQRAQLCVLLSALCTTISLTDLSPFLLSCCRPDTAQGR